MCAHAYIESVIKASLFNEKIEKSSAVESLTANGYPPPGVWSLILYKPM